MLTREKLGYSGTGDIKYLLQDLEALKTDLGRDEPIDHGELLPRASECEKEAKRLGVPDVIADALIQRARALRQVGRFGEAIEALRSARQELGALLQYDLSIGICSGLAETYASQARWDEASDACSEGIRRIEQQRNQVNSQYLQSSFLRSGIQLYRLGVEAAYRIGNVELMLGRAELAKCRSVLRQRKVPAVPPSAEETRIEQRLREVRREIVAASTAGVGGEAIALLRAKRRSLWDLLLIERARSGGEAEIPDFNLNAVQAALTPDEAILYYYWLDSERLLIVLIDRHKVIHELKSVTDQSGALERFCAGILEPPTSRSGLDQRSILDPLDTFAPLLFPKAIAEGLTKEHNRLLISPHQMLHAVPFHAVRWDPQHRFLIGRFAVTYIPNLRSLLVPYVPSAPRSLLALAIDDYEGRVSEAGDKLTPIPEAAEEARNLKTVYAVAGCDVTILTGRATSWSNLAELADGGTLGTFARLHLALHGQSVDSDTPMESHLELFDVGLDGIEIANWRLGADLVVLSACCSGQRPSEGRGMGELPGDDLFGLQAAFFAAGAKRIVCSLWPVESSIASPLMTRFHRSLLAGQPPECALQTAIVGLLRDYGRGRLERYYWAPFFLSAVGRQLPEEERHGSRARSQDGTRIRRQRRGEAGSAADRRAAQFQKCG